MLRFELFSKENLVSSEAYSPEDKGLTSRYEELYF